MWYGGMGEGRVKEGGDGCGWRGAVNVISMIHFSLFHGTF